MMEIFRDYEGVYQVSTLGRVKNSKTGNILKATLNKNGYLYVRLGRGRNVAVHRMVAEAFKPNPHNYPTVDHINRIRTDNRLENLRWAPMKLQCKNSDNKNRESVKKSLSKPVEQYTLNMEFVAEYPSVAEAAKANGFIATFIAQVARGKRKSAYKHIWVYKEKGT